MTSVSPWPRASPSSAARSAGAARVSEGGIQRISVSISSVPQPSRMSPVDGHETAQPRAVGALPELLEAEFRGALSGRLALHGDPGELGQLVAPRGAHEQAHGRSRSRSRYSRVMAFQRLRSADSAALSPFRARKAVSRSSRT